jgi:hypothetical protein
VCGRVVRNVAPVGWFSEIASRGTIMCDRRVHQQHKTTRQIIRAPNIRSFWGFLAGEAAVRFVQNPVRATSSGHVRARLSRNHVRSNNICTCETTSFPGTRLTPPPAISRHSSIVKPGRFPGTFSANSLKLQSAEFTAKLVHSGVYRQHGIARSKVIFLTCDRYILTLPRSARCYQSVHVHLT